MPAVDMTRIPAQTQQAVAAQQGATNVSDMETVLATLAQDPAAMSQALAALGIQVSPEELQQVAENWVDAAADKASGESTSDSETAADAEAEGDTGGSPRSSPSAPSAPQAPRGPMDASGNDVEATGPDGSEDEGSEGEGDTTELSARSRQPQAAAAPQAEAQDPRAAALARAVGGGGMPTRGPASPMDDIVSAAMMQQMAGNPNAPVPTGPQMPRPGMPRTPSAAASGDPRMRGLIANIYRSVAAQNSAADRVGVPTRPRVAGGAAARPRRATTRRSENVR